MIRKPYHLVAITSVIAIVFLLWFPSSTWGQRYCCEGESWLRWDRNRREAYVTGYVLGYYRGYNRGCEQGTKNWPRPIAPGNDPAAKCLDNKYDFSRGTDYFLTQVTEFYRRYPENRNLLIDEILEELGKGNKIESIHNHPPFPARNSSKGSNEKGEMK